MGSRTETQGIMLRLTLPIMRIYVDAAYGGGVEQSMQMYQAMEGNLTTHLILSQRWFKSPELRRRYPLEQIDKN